MIVIDKDRKEHSLWEKEIERASQSLTNIIRFDMKISTEVFLDVNIIVIPYQNYEGRFTHDINEVDKEDVYLPKHKHSFVETRANDNIFLTRDSIAINLSKVPEKYSFMDLFAFPPSLGHRIIADTMELKVTSEEENIEEFSYKREFGYRKELHGIHICTLAKVSDGWKFHPQFIDTLMNADKVLSLGVGGFYDKFYY